MKRFFFASIFSLVLAVTMGSCSKDVVTEPEIVICYFQPTVPVRIITESGVDLLSPAKLPLCTVGVQAGETSAGYKFYQVTPNVFTKTGQADEYYFPISMPDVDSKSTTYISLKTNVIDTLVIKTSAASSKPFGVTSITLNSRIIEPKLLFNGSVYGIEIVMPELEK